MELYALKLSDNYKNRSYEEYLKFVPINIQQRIKRKSNIGDFKRSLLGYLLISVILDKHFNVNISKINMLTNENGKPYIDGDLYFNISHSNKWVVCVIDVQPVGIDIENTKSINIERMTNILSPKEKEYIFSFPENERNNIFFKIWVVKESYSKAIGTGITRNILSSNTFYENNYSKIQLPDKIFHFQLFNLNNYNISLCSTKNKHVKIKFLKEEDFLDCLIRSH